MIHKVSASHKRLCDRNIHSVISIYQMSPSILRLKLARQATITYRNIQHKQSSTINLRRSPKTRSNERFFACPNISSHLPTSKYLPSVKLSTFNSFFRFYSTCWTNKSASASWTISINMYCHPLASPISASSTQRPNHNVYQKTHPRDSNSSSSCLATSASPLLSRSQIENR